MFFKPTGAFLYILVVLDETVDIYESNILLDPIFSLDGFIPIFLKATNISTLTKR